MGVFTSHQLNFLLQQYLLSLTTFGNIEMLIWNWHLSISLSNSLQFVKNTKDGLIYSLRFSKTYSMMWCISPSRNTLYSIIRLGIKSKIEWSSMLFMVIKLYLLTIKNTKILSMGTNIINRLRDQELPLKLWMRIRAFRLNVATTPMLKFPTSLGWSLESVELWRLWANQNLMW